MLRLRLARLASLHGLGPQIAQGLVGNAKDLREPHALVRIALQSGDGAALEGGALLAVLREGHHFAVVAGSELGGSEQTAGNELGADLREPCVANGGHAAQGEPGSAKCALVTE